MNLRSLWLPIRENDMIHPARIAHLNSSAAHRGDFVVYWMQQSQRIEYNHAFTYAIEQANKLGQPLIVFFALTDGFPEANLRHYYFMLTGLAETYGNLSKRGIRMVVLHCDPPTGVTGFAKRASVVVTDSGYLRIQKEWRRKAAQLLHCPLIQIESDVIVPVTEASPKEEYAAVTIRSKLHKRLAEYFTDFKTPQIKRDSLSFENNGIDLSDPVALCKKLAIDHSVGPVDWIRSGEKAAGEMLESFIETKLDHFKDLRNDPSQDYLSNMSPYLHFGQISPLKIAQKIVASGSNSTEAFLEELFVRRELAMNFVHYNEAYDSYECLPVWCRKTLDEHRFDKREYLYTNKQLELAVTHDSYWNAAQKEMVVTGKMHGYMRMYWSKKILEWSRSPEKAYTTALALNNKYNLDGRDPNGFAGVAWCFGKHDRAWGERAVFGKIRFMNENGLRRKFYIDEYVRRVEEACKK
jgi:deoxyribodipyrimidine photo-lyase